MNPHTPTPSKDHVGTANHNAYTKNAKTNSYASRFGNSAQASSLTVWVAMRLAKDVETCCSLLRGEPVDPSRLDEGELAAMRSLRLVRLDVRAIAAVEDSLRRSRLVEVLRAAA